MAHVKKEAKELILSSFDLVIKDVVSSRDDESPAEKIEVVQISPRLAFNAEFIEAVREMGVQKEITERDNKVDKEVNMADVE